MGAVDSTEVAVVIVVGHQSKNMVEMMEGGDLPVTGGAATASGVKSPDTGRAGSAVSSSAEERATSYTYVLASYIADGQTCLLGMKRGQWHRPGDEGGADHSSNPPLPLRLMTRRRGIEALCVGTWLGCLGFQW